MISARLHYASLALIELALRQGKPAPVAVREISELHGIPAPFLVQILRTLRGKGWVRSVRGSQGGYRLAVDPAQLTLLEIADAVGCSESSCQTESNETVANGQLHEVWGAAVQASRDVLAETTLADIASKCSPSEAVMFYI
ncbi:Rrf2 family transcriptional regulator [Roseiconus nitratireducens]|uniref:Rrf2 family transcriptional regulator n=1 Tax=Roseiconus nitratireducens TaxID=2605748 RepID=A0A5M6D6E0_9BACT|nr:Rrf2 family transcriptional regulator [Roseiconus nitratireducens]KAA5543094.1 Rrf2 family transcriptional regulator [Roseiconus nitratireducens]